MTILSWRTWSSALLLFLSISFTTVYANSPSFENTAVVRTVELGGDLTHITARYSVRALNDGVGEYTFALGEEDHDLTSWMQAKVKGADEELQLKPNGHDSKRYAATRLGNLPLF
jgi:dolichyl-diphosphooligosaccharide---protein glycosyltransferase subunit 1 (ribophorin I)